MLPGGSSGHQLLKTLFNSPWAWDCVIVGAIGGGLFVGILWAVFVLGAGTGGRFEKRVMRAVDDREVSRGSSVVGSRAAAPSTVDYYLPRYDGSSSYDSA